MCCYGTKSYDLLSSPNRATPGTARKMSTSGNSDTLKEKKRKKKLLEVSKANIASFYVKPQWNSSQDGL